MSPVAFPPSFFAVAPTSKGLLGAGNLLSLKKVQEEGCFPPQKNSLAWGRDKKGRLRK